MNIKSRQSKKRINAHCIYTTTLYTLYSLTASIIIYTQLHNYKITCEKNWHSDNMTQLLLMYALVVVVCYGRINDYNCVKVYMLIWVYIQIAVKVEGKRVYRGK